MFFYIAARGCGCFEMKLVADAEVPLPLRTMFNLLTIDFFLCSQSKS